MPNQRSNGLNTSTIFNTTLFSSNTSYYIQEWNIPGVVTAHPSEKTRMGQMVINGDMIEYRPLYLKLLIDEDLVIWKDIISVMQSYQKPGTNTYIPIEGESFVEVYDSKNKYLFKIVFHGSFIESVGELNYMTLDDNEPITLSLTILYDYYTVE